MRRNLIIAIVLLAVLGVGAAYVWQQQQAAELERRSQIRQEVLKRGTILGSVSATGPLAANIQVNLFFGVSGSAPVAKVNVALGDEVTQGEVLAQLDTLDLELAVAQAEQSVQAAQFALDQLQAPAREVDIQLAEANLRVANNQVYQATQGNSPQQIEIARLNLVTLQTQLNQTYARMKNFEDNGRFADKLALQPQADKLIEEARIAELRYQQAQNLPGYGRAGSALAAIDQAKIALDRLQNGPRSEDIDVARLQLSQAKTSLQLARNNLADAQIIAPFAGVVAAVNVRASEPVVGAQPAIIMADLTQFYLEVSVDEVDIARIAVGQLVTITLDALPTDTFSGVVERIAPQSSSLAGVVNFPVRITLKSGNPLLRGGMTATAEIIVQRAENVVLVPNWAIRRDRATGQNLASILRNGELVEVPVQLGLRGEAYSEVRSGLAEGDVVAISTAREQFSLFGGN